MKTLIVLRENQNIEDLERINNHIYISDSRYTDLSNVVLQFDMDQYLEDYIRKNLNYILEKIGRINIEDIRGLFDLIVDYAILNSDRFVSRFNLTKRSDTGLNSMIINDYLNW